MGENHTGSDAFLKTSFDVLLGRITLGGESYWVSCIVRITLSFGGQPIWVLLLCLGLNSFGVKGIILVQIHCLWVRLPVGDPVKGISLGQKHFCTISSSLTRKCKLI